MFSSASQPGHRAPMASMYRGVGATIAVEGASPHKLVSMLYQAVAGDIAAARGAMARGDIAEKGRAIGHAVRIVEEGLVAPLDLEAGGALAVNLRDLYDYIVRRLTLANLKSDDAALADCATLVQTMRESWDAIAPQVASPAQAAA
jgi:flagellar secretion chaperone FliS